MHLTLRQLQMIVAIADRRSLSRAAQAMNVAQPSLTRSLREAEAGLGVKLFERTPRGMAPTIFGEVLVRHGKAVDAELRGATDEIQALNRGGAGRVAIGVTLLGTAALVPRAIAAFSVKWPTVTVQLIHARDNADAATRLLSGDLDLAVRPSPEHGPEEGLIEDYLFTSQLGVWARGNHPLFRRGAVALQDLLDFGWVLPVKSVAPRRQLDNVFRQRGLIPPRAMVETASLEAIRALLLQTDWLTLLPDFVFRDEGVSEPIKPLPVALPGAQRPIGVSRRASGTLSPAARALLMHIKQAAASFA